MGYAMIMFFIMLLMALAISLSANYGISKDSEEAPLLAQNAYADREGGKGQTDFVVEMAKVNGTMRYTSVDGGTASDPLNLYLRIKNNGSTILSPLKYSILLNGTWVPISSTSDNSTYPLNNSTVVSLNLTQRPLSLMVSSENGIKIIVPSPPKFFKIDAIVNTSDPSSGSNCYIDLAINWTKSIGNWPIDRYAVYYTFTDNIDKNDVNMAFTVGADTDVYLGNAYYKEGGKCDNNSASSQVYVWMTAYDTHGNEGVPSNTCLMTVGNPSGEYCPK